MKKPDALFFTSTKIVNSTAVKFKDGATDGHYSRSLSCDTISNTPGSTNSLAQPKLLFSKIEKFYVNVQSCGVLSIYSSKMTKEEED